MSTLTPPRTSLHRTNDAPRLTRLSLWMLPVFALVGLVTSFVGVYVVFPLVGLEEGDVLLMAHSVAGWVWAVAFWVLLLAAPVTGVVLAARALARGGARAARTALVLNGVLVLIAVYMVFDEVRLAYFPSVTLPFPG